jgi:calcineurin-like phosphoesterase family protein
MIWFTADTHFNHTNIIKYCNRPFKNVNEMNNSIIDNWNSLVLPTDLVYILGDFGMGNCQYMFDNLYGMKTLIIGSHDKYSLGLNWVKKTHTLQIRGKHPDIHLSHYAHRTWPKSFHGSWHLYGHSHGKLPPYGYSFDVGVDCWGFKPISIDQVIEEMAQLGQGEVI